MTKIRVNKSNSKVIEGRLFISLLKAQSITSKILSALIEYGNSIVFPERINMETGEFMPGEKFVEYKGSYIRVTK